MPIRAVTRAEIGELVTLIWVVTTFVGLIAYTAVIIDAKRPALSGRYEFAFHAAIARHESAQARHIDTHSSISPMRSQSSAHSLQISAHSRQVCL